MKQYISFFRMRIIHGLQYRAAALAGVVTQFAWGGLAILGFRAFYESNPSAFPMEFQSLSTYLWFQQAFLALFMTWFFENELFELIRSGNIAYELCKPFDIYNMWFTKCMANRIAKTLLRCFPILLVAVFLPHPYGLMAPVSTTAFILFVITLILCLFVVVAFGMLIYIVTFYTVSPNGIRIISASLVEFLSGAIIPIPFLPNEFRQIVELLPFASMQNVPFRIYTGDLIGNEMLIMIGLQIFWIVALILIGKVAMNRALQKVVVQGG